VSVQICEGAWRNRRGQRVLVTHGQSVGGQQWTDGVYHFGDDGSSVAGRESPEDLVRFIAPLVTVAQTESTTAVAGGVSEDPGRIIHELEERLKTANATIIGQTSEIDRLKAEWQAEFTVAQQLRSEVAQLERLLDDARGNLRVLEADGTTMDHHCEGQKAAFLAVIKTLWEMRR